MNDTDRTLKVVRRRRQIPSEMELDRSMLDGSDDVPSRQTQLSTGKSKITKKKPVTKEKPSDGKRLDEAISWLHFIFTNIATALRPQNPHVAQLPFVQTTYEKCLVLNRQGTHPITASSLSQDGRTLLAGDNAGNITEWNSVSGSLLTSTTRHFTPKITDPIVHLAYFLGFRWWGVVLAVDHKGGQWTWKPLKGKESGTFLSNQVLGPPSGWYTRSRPVSVSAWRSLSTGTLLFCSTTCATRDNGSMPMTQMKIVRWPTSYFRPGHYSNSREVEVVALNPQINPVCAAFSKDGKTLAVGVSDEGGSVQFYDTRTGQPTRRSVNYGKFPFYPIYMLASPVDQSLVVAYADGEIRLYRNPFSSTTSADDFIIVRRAQLGPSANMEEWIHRVTMTFSSDGGLLFYSAIDIDEEDQRRLRIFDAHQGGATTMTTELVDWPEHSEVSGISVSPDNQRLILTFSGKSDMLVFCWGEGSLVERVKRKVRLWLPFPFNLILGVVAFWLWFSCGISLLDMSAIGIAIFSSAFLYSM